MLLLPALAVSSLLGSGTVHHLGEERSSACAKKFHIHVVKKRPGDHCGDHDEARDAFLEALGNHPCHSASPEDAGSVVVSAGIHRLMNDKCEKTSRALISSLPAAIARHPRLFFFTDGPIINYGALREEYPQAIWLTEEPDASCGGMTEHDYYGHGRVCWSSANATASASDHMPYVCNEQVRGIPYVVGAEKAEVEHMALKASEVKRSQLVAYFAGMHGTPWAMELRTRLYEACDDDWVCLATADKPGMQLLRSRRQPPQRAPQHIAHQLGRWRDLFSRSALALAFSGGWGRIGRDSTQLNPGVASL